MSTHLAATKSVSSLHYGLRAGLIWRGVPLRERLADFAASLVYWWVYSKMARSHLFRQICKAARVREIMAALLLQ